MRAIIKLAWLAAFSVLTLALPVAWLAVMALALLASALLLRASPVRLWKMFLPAVPFVVILAMLQALLQGTGAALGSSARIVLLYLAGSAVTSTTGESEMAAALEKLLGIFGNTVARDLSTMTMLAIAFMPIVRDEYEAIKAAQEARGVSFRGPGAWKGVVSVAVPLLYSLADRADHIALAMEARCYGLK